MMSSSGFRPFDELSEQYEDEWLQLGLEDDTLKCSSPPANGTSDFGLTVATRSCPSPLSHIPTREPYPSDPPPKLSPVSSEQQTFITLSNSRIPPVPPGPSQSMLQPSTQTHSSELTSIEYELNPDLNVLSIPSSSPLLATKPAELQYAQPSVSGLQQNGEFASFVQLEQREKRAVVHPQQQQQQHPGCVHTVNGQWFVQAQVQHVQTSAGTVIAVVPNFCRTQMQPSGNNSNVSQVQVSQPQLIAHSVANGQPVGTSQPAQHVLQTHPHHQLQQQQQQIVHTTRMSNSLSGAPQQGQSVMQHLLSQPTISRPQVQATVQPMTSTPVITKKQRNSQPRNGRRKNVNQGGTLGAVLAKANKLAAAASTDASLNQMLPPSHGIEMRLSVQNSEQVANLSKEISRLQNLQATYNVDHSAEIKDLENKRAQIFFEALAQQHKDKDLLSAVNPKPATSASHNRQRTTIPNNHNNANAMVIHQMQPSTSYEQQQQQQQHQQPQPQPNYETVSARVPVSYHSSYQMSHYTSTHDTLQSNSYSAPTNSHIQQVSTTQYGSYRPTPSQSQVQQSQVRESYIQTSVPNSSPQQQSIIMQHERRPSARAVPEIPCEPPRPPVLLFPPPTFKSSAKAAADIAEKKAERTKRIKDYFSSMHGLVEHPDISTPFRDLSDLLHRLLPFHVYSEPDLNSDILNNFDYDCQRHFVHLQNRRNIVEQRIRSLMYKEAMEGNTKADECLLLSIDSEHERRLLDEEKRVAIVSDKDEFVSNSPICSCLTAAEVERRRKELVPKSMPKLHFDYHAFSESEIAARTRSLSPFTGSDEEMSESKSIRLEGDYVESADLDEKVTESVELDEKVAKYVGSDNEDALLSDLVDDAVASEHGSTVTSMEGVGIKFDEEKSEANCSVAEKNPVGNDWTDLSPLPELTSTATCCTSRKNTLSESTHRELRSPAVADPPEQTFLAKSAVSIKSAAQLEAIIALAHAASLERIPSPVTAEENESIENCIPVEDASKISETEVVSCDNDSQNLERKSLAKTEEIERPPIRIKIALTDASLKNCLNKNISKKNKEKKKKKRKHHLLEPYNKEVNGVLPSCSGMENVKMEDATLHNDDISHPRILMRITRKNNVVSLADPQSNHNSLQKESSKDEVEERVPPLKVPKLKIRLGRIREESVNDVEKSTNLVQNIVPHEMTRLKFNCGSEASRQSQIAGAERDRKMTIVIPKSLVTNSCVSPCNTNNSISAVSSNAQFSPTSDLSDEEADEQLRAQADSVISRLNDWGTNHPVSHQADALSRLVGAAPLVSPVLDRLLPSNSWLLNMNLKHHSTVATAATTTTTTATTTTTTNDTAYSCVPWLASTTTLMQQTSNQPRSLKTTISINKSH